jgi:hypothetical protein
MCEGSIHVRNRKATDKEKLVVRTIPGMSLKGYYPREPKAADGYLVCVRGNTTKAIIKQVQLLSGMAPATEKLWQGKRNVEVTLRHRAYSDTILMPNGVSVHLMMFKDGMRIDIGYPVKVRKPAGMKVVEGAMREALALPPEPKPAEELDENNLPVDPTDGPAEPAKEPAPAGDAPAPAARRRR